MFCLKFAWKLQKRNIINSILKESSLFCFVFLFILYEFPYSYECPLSIHINASIYPTQGHEKNIGSLFQGTWTVDREPTNYRPQDTHTHTTDNLEMSVNIVCCWTWGGNWQTPRKPSKQYFNSTLLCYSLNHPTTQLGWLIWPQITFQVQISQSRFGKLT